MTPYSAFAIDRRSFLQRAAAAGSGLLLSERIFAAEIAKPVIEDWTTADMPSQTGRSFIVTGGTSGMGYEDALALARAGGDVIIAARDAKRGAETIERIRSAVPGARARFEALDLADLRSVTEFASRVRASRSTLDVLINNAAVMAIPDRKVSVDGFEMQLATNYLGHFALTAQLLPLLRAGRDARVVNLSSVAAARGAMAFDDLQMERGYDAMKAYAQTKLAAILFAFEFDRRSRTAGWQVKGIAAHPGVSRTELLLRGPGRASELGQMYERQPERFQTAAMGALPTLYAATSAEAQGGAYYGPREEQRGLPAFATVPAAALDTATAARLWQVSEQLTRVKLA